MGRKLAECVLLASILVGYVAWGTPVPISGTFHKGASFGGEHQLVGPVLQIRNELGLGSVEGGILTGSAEYTIREEIVNLAGGVGTLRAEVKISKPNGSGVLHKTPLPKIDRCARAAPAVLVRQSAVADSS